MLRFFRIISIFCIIIIMSVDAYALQRPVITNVRVSNNSIKAFVNDCIDKEIKKISIADRDVRDFEKIDDIFSRTAILIDSTTSENEEYNNVVKSIIYQLLIQRDSYESFVIANISSNLNYISEDSDDYISILESVDNIETYSKDKESLCDALYIFLDDLEKSSFQKYNQIILISDKDEKINGLAHKKKELEKKIKDAGIPIYTLGYDMKVEELESDEKNTEKLFKNLFALSKFTKSEAYLLQKKEDIIHSIREISEIKKTTSKVIIFSNSFTKDVKDASLKIYFDNNNYCETNINIPITENAKMDSISDNSKANIDKNFNNIDYSSFNQNILLKNIIIIMMAVLILIIVIIVIILIMYKKKQGAYKNNKDNFIDMQQYLDVNNEYMKYSNNMMNKNMSKSYEEKDNKTSVIINTKKVFYIHLQDKADPTRYFDHAFKDKILIGKDSNLCQIVINYSPYISATHCEIFVRNNSLFVRDGADGVISSTNGTLVNGKMASPEAPLPNGSLLSLANLNFKVSYK